MTIISDAVGVKHDHARIPGYLKEIPRWILWKAGEPDERGKFAKFPISPKTGGKVNALEPKNWLTYSEAAAQLSDGVGTGLGFVLDGAGIQQPDGTQLYLHGLDFDLVDAAELAEIKQLQRQLGGAYGEVSPSGKGIRMFALSRQKLRSCRRGNREFYSEKRFLTVTGMGGKGQICEATEALAQFHTRLLTNPAVDFSTLEPVRSQFLNGAQGGSNNVSTDAAVKQVAQAAELEMPHLWAGRWETSADDILGIGYASQSDADLALAGCIARCASSLGVGLDALPICIESVFGMSKLGERSKWIDRQDYRDRTIAKAIDGLQVTPTPRGGGAMYGVQPAMVTRSLMTAEELKALPSAPYRVRGLLPERGVGSIYGPSGSGKTFVDLDLLAAIAGGNSDWFGHRVKQAPTVYIALEGAGGVPKRIKAWEAQHNRAIPDAMRFKCGGFSLLSVSDVDTLAAEILDTLGPGCVVAIDTLNQAAPGADENSSQDMSRVIANAKMLSDAIAGLVILVHHSGKDQARGMRGHSSLFAAMDAVIEVSEDKNGFRSWKATKTKDDALGTSYGFELVGHVVGQDDDGQNITSCAIRRAFVLPTTQVAPPKGKRQLAAMQVVSELLARYPDGVPVDTVVTAVANVMDVSQPRKLTNAKEALVSLTNAGHICQHGGVISKPGMIA